MDEDLEDLTVLSLRLDSSGLRCELKLFVCGNPLARILP